MNLLWQNPALLWLAAALTLGPLAAHLLSRVRPREVIFPSLLWLQQVRRRSVRIKQPKDWLLLLIRTLAVAALAAAFALPLWFDAQRLAATDDSRTLILVVDRSASMAWSERGQTRLATAAQRALKLLDQAGARTLANIVWIDSQPTAEFPTPGTHLGALRSTLQRDLQPTSESGDVASAFRVALEQAGQGSGAREVYLLSDFQATQWQAAELKAPANVKVYHIACADTPAANAAVSSLRVEPAHPIAGGEVRLLAQVRLFDTEPRSTTAYLQFGDTRLSRPVELPPMGEATLEFRLPCDSAGRIAATVSLAEDAFPADDAHHAVIDVRESMSLRVLGPVGKPDDTSATAVWQRLGKAFPWLAPSTDTATPPDLLLLPTATPADLAEATAALRAGSTVILTPSTGLAGAGAPFPIALTGLRLESRPTSGPGWRLKESDPDLPLWALFARGDYGDPADASVWQRWQWEAPLPAEAEPLLQFEDGTPALLQMPMEKGTLLVSAVPLDETATDWPTRQAFVPFIGELLLRCAPQPQETTLHESLPGRPLTWSHPQVLHADQVTLRPLQDSTTPLPLDLETSGDGTRITSRQTVGTGHYAWSVDGQISDRTCVNFPASESDLRHLTPDEWITGEALTLDSSAALAAHRDGLPLWPSLLLAAAALLLLEGLLLRGFALTSRKGGATA